MKKLPIILAVAIIILLFSPPGETKAVTIASQQQDFASRLKTWQAIQELGSNLTGTLDKFTFRVATSKSNLNQFDYTAENSRIYDKTNNSSIAGCVPANSQGVLRGLTFNTEDVPAGFQDVTVDFSCRNYNFIPDHKYLIRISNANMGNLDSGLILFAAASYLDKAADYFIAGGLRYANGNKFDFQNNGGSCDAVSYKWGGTDPWHNGCYVWTTPKDDLFFTLSNNAPPPPPPRLPVIFIPGIGGSELKASQQIFWTADNGHGGIYSHGYEQGEKIWVNQDEAVKLGDDDYFDVLRLKPDGQTAEAALDPTGELSPFGYGEIDSFFSGMGYIKGSNFFTFAYDWRKDVRTNNDSLDSLIEQAKQKSGQSKVNLVVHSMGGLIARYYISDSQKAAKVNKLIELGIPHLGSVYALKTLMYGVLLGRPLIGDFGIGVAPSEIHDVSQNLSSVFSLLPSNQYFNFYNNFDKDHPYPFRDDRNIDNDNVTGALNYSQIKSLLSNLGYNMPVFNLGEKLHNFLDPILNQISGTKIYEIVGSSQPTLGQIHETWWITWPINVIPKTDEIYINGDDTVPLYSASLRKDNLDISGATRIYYVEQKHGDLTSANGAAMQTVKAILNDDNSLPVEVKNEKIALEGQQLSLDDGDLDLYDDANHHCGLNSNGEMEENIPEVICTTSGNTKHTFVKKKAAKVKVIITRKNPASSSKTTSLKNRTYRQDKVAKTSIYKDITLAAASKIEFTLDPALDTSPTLAFFPDSIKNDSSVVNITSEATGSAALDQTSPKTTIQILGIKDSSGIYTAPVTIALTSQDSDSGILKIEYSLNVGQTVQTYTAPFTISTPGKTTLQFTAIDKAGNEEIPQTITIEIAIPSAPTPTPTTISTGSNSSDNSNNTSKVGFNSFEVSNTADPSVISISNPPAVLGIQFPNPSHVSDQINISHLLDNLEKPKISKNKPSAQQQILGGLLIVSGTIVTLASLGLIFTFIKPVPGKM